jgi:hypothetical protein
MAEPNALESAISAPPELVEKAEAAVRDFEVQCFWFWHPEARIRTLSDVREVITELRRHGNRQAWLAAQDLQRCL